jgi:hypothetical protein
MFDDDDDTVQEIDAAVVEASKAQEEAMISVLHTDAKELEGLTDTQKLQSCEIAINVLLDKLHAKGHTKSWLDKISKTKSKCHPR